MWQAVTRGLAMIRAQQWAGQKLGPVLAVFFASCLLQDRSIAASWPQLLQLAIAIAAGAVWVSLVNDAADREQDRAAGKPNRLDGKSSRFIALVLALPALVGVAIALTWRDDPVLLLVYATAWIVFTLYSVPPARLKERGLAGVLADATGAHLLPAMIALLLALRAAPASAAPLWIGAVAIWSLGYGLRGILWHQLFDLERDRRAKVATFAALRGRAPTVRLARRVAFPLELAGLAAMLLILAQPLVVAMLALYAAMALLVTRFTAVRYTVVEDPPCYRLLLTKFNDLLFPLALLLASIVTYRDDMIVLVIWALLASPQIVELASEGWTLGMGGMRRVVGAIRARP